MMHSLAHLSQPKDMLTLLAVKFFVSRFSVEDAEHNFAVWDGFSALKKEMGGGAVGAGSGPGP
jgi:hypothetical protein